MIARRVLGNFDIYLDIEGEALVHQGASCFLHQGAAGLYLYRTKYGHWCIGEILLFIRNLNGNFPMVL